MTVYVQHDKSIMTKSLAYGTYKDRYDLWMLQGYPQPGWRNQITSAFGSKVDH